MLQYNNIFQIVFPRIILLDFLLIFKPIANYIYVKNKINQSIKKDAPKDMRASTFIEGS